MLKYILTLLLIISCGLLGYSFDKEWMWLRISSIASTACFATFFIIEVFCM